MADVSDDQQLGEKIIEMIRNCYMFSIAAMDGGCWIIGEKNKKSCSVVDGGGGSEQPAKKLLGMLEKIEKVLS